MADKKDPGKFTVRFNIHDPQHQTVVALLNQQGRNKAQFLASAVLHYINCKEICEINTAEEPQTKEESEGWPGRAGEVSAILDSLKMFDNL